MWYSKDENAMIYQSCIKQVQKMNRGKILRDQKYCSRGLERHTPAGQMSKLRNKKDASEAVMKEQLRQKERNIFDEDAISKIYNQTTRICQLRATEIGLLDQKAVQE